MCHRAQCTISLCSKPSWSSVVPDSTICSRWFKAVGMDMTLFKRCLQGIPKEIVLATDRAFFIFKFAVHNKAGHSIWKLSNDILYPSELALNYCYQQFLAVRPAPYLNTRDPVSQLKAKVLLKVGDIKPFGPILDLNFWKKVRVNQIIFLSLFLGFIFLTWVLYYILCLKPQLSRTFL